MSRLVVLVAVVFGCWATASAAPPKAAQEFTGHLTGSISAGFSPDGKRFASQAAAIEVGGSEVLVWDVATGKQTHKFPLSHGFAFDPTGDRLAIGLAKGRATELTVLDLKTGKAVWHITEADASAIGWPSYSPDGKVLYYRVEYVAADLPEVSIKTADATTGKPGTVLIDKQRAVRRSVLTADGKRAVNVRSDTITVCDSATGKLTAKLSGHKYGVGSVVLVPGDKFLASTGQDDTVRVWDLEKGKEVWSRSHRAPARPSSPRTES